MVGSNSCKKNSKTLYNTEFPNGIGTLWKYKVYDSVYNYFDTVFVKVVGFTQLITGEEVSMWQSIGIVSGNVDSVFVSSSSNGIIVYASRNANSIINKYVFPLHVGDKWLMQHYLDTNKVTVRASFTVPAGTFAEAYRINRMFNSLPGYNRTVEEEWFVPNVGIVSRYLNIISQGYVSNTKWELIDYQIR